MSNEPENSLAVLDKATSKNINLTDAVINHGQNLVSIASKKTTPPEVRDELLNEINKIYKTSQEMISQSEALLKIRNQLVHSLESKK